MAVYTDVSDSDLTRFMAEYALGEVLSCKGIAEGVENSNFLLRTTGGSFILTLYEKRVNPEDLPFFIGLMEHLAARGFSCPVPVKAKDGRSLRRLCGRPAAVITFLEGLWPREILPFHCAGIGDTLARLHLAAEGFPIDRPNDLGLAGWHRLAAATSDRADEIEPGLAAELEAELAALDAAWPCDLPGGICHADLFPDNVFFRDRQVTGVIDFYFACTDFFAYDVAVCLNAWCFGLDRIFEPERSTLLFDAYRRVRKLSDAEIAAMPVLARGAALRFLLTRLYDWLNRAPGALVRPKDPREYLAKLRFHRQVSGPEVYGL
jgi:homoserine kinase type II